jgi:hypothetical protein
MPLGGGGSAIPPINDGTILSMRQPAVFSVSFTVGKLTCKRAEATHHPAPWHRIGLFESRAFGERILRPKARVPLAAAALGFLVPLICRGILPPFASISLEMGSSSCGHERVTRLQSP